MLHYFDVSFFKLLILSLMLYYPAKAGTAEDPWEKKLDKNGIAVYTHKPEGARILAFKAISTYSNTSIEDVGNVIRQVEDWNEWISDCKSVEILDSIGEEELIYHVLVKVPFPLEKRDLIQRMKVTRESETTVRISLEGMPDYLETRKGTVRMPVADGYWLLTDLENGDVRVEFEHYSDPGGGIPAWIINMFIVQSPYKTLFNLRKMVKAD
jgi:hypothetical protein